MRLAHRGVVPRLILVMLFAASGIGCGGYSPNNGSGGNGGGRGASVPPVPVGLTATAGDAQVALSWSASSGATGYYVKRSTASGGPYRQIAALAGTSFTDTGLTNGTEYFYAVSAYNSAGASANSAEANATPMALTANVTITINPAVSKPISPYIYGTNFYSGNTAPQPAFTLDRAGGNRWTAYNWNNNGSNAGSDYFYENDDYLCNGSCNAAIPAEAVRQVIADDETAGLASLVTLQLQGYVSKDTTVVQVAPPFPDLTYFRPVVDKKSTASSAAFTLTPPAASIDNNVYMDEFAWALDQKFASQDIFGATATHPVFISLDNEPDLWNSTHQEIQGATNVS